MTLVFSFKRDATSVCDFRRVLGRSLTLITVIQDNDVLHPLAFIDLVYGLHAFVGPGKLCFLVVESRCLRLAQGLLLVVGGVRQIDSLPTYQRF